MADFLDGAVRRQTAHELVREHLRRAILSGEAPGGTRLIQSEVAERLRVSTTPVREALRDLVTEGLVEFDPHRGAVVHETNRDEALELYATREVVEPLALRFAHKRPALSAIESAELIQVQLDATNDPAEWAELNWRFHASLIAPASARLRAIVKVLQDSAALYVAHVVVLDPTRIPEGNAEHHRILQALRVRDIEGAASHLRGHMSSTLQGILSYSSDGSSAMTGAADSS